jgi:hypothetical protein
MSRFLLVTAACFLLLLSGSCDTSFNPAAPFQPRMVVYSVLSTESDTQYVRVYTTYNPPGGNPSDNPDEISVTDAQVTISEEGGTTQTFQPISIERPDTTRYSTKISAYYAYPFRPTKGKGDTLTVTSPLYGLATATVTVPGAGLILATNELLLKDPWNVPLDDIILSIRLSPPAKGYLVKFYIDYESLDSAGRRTHRVEVPVSVWRAVDGKLLGYFYPEIQRRHIPTTQGELIDYREQFGYLTEAYQETINDIVLSASTVRFKQAVFFLIQFDAPLYNYYSIANGFRDRNSIRLDEASYTNIIGGVGLFGSLAVDSAVVALPEHFPPRRY